MYFFSNFSVLRVIVIFNVAFVRVLCMKLPWFTRISFRYLGADLSRISEKKEKIICIQYYEYHVLIIPC